MRIYAVLFFIVSWFSLLNGMETHVYYDNDSYHVYFPTQNQYAAISHAQVQDIINHMPPDARPKAGDLVYLAHYMYEHNADLFNQCPDAMPEQLVDPTPGTNKAIYYPPFPHASYQQQYEFLSPQIYREEERMETLYLKLRSLVRL